MIRRGGLEGSVWWERRLITEESRACCCAPGSVDTPVNYATRYTESIARPTTQDKNIVGVDDDCDNGGIYSLPPQQRQRLQYSAGRQGISTMSSQCALADMALHGMKKSTGKRRTRRNQSRVPWKSEEKVSKAQARGTKGRRMREISMHATLCIAQ